MIIMTLISLNYKVKILKLSVYYQLKKLTKRNLVLVTIILLSSLIFFILSKENLLIFRIKINKKNQFFSGKNSVDKIASNKNIISKYLYQKIKFDKYFLNDKNNQENSFSWSNEHHIWTIRDSIELSSSNKNNFKRDKIEELVGNIWPNENDKNFYQQQDRIINQLLLSKKFENKVFNIYPPNDQLYPIGNELFVKEKCPINNCKLTYDKNQADALIFLNSDVLEEPIERFENQIWIAYLLESPINTFDKRFKRLKRGNHKFNWTASYRSDSDIVTPYSKFLPYLSQLNNFFKLLNYSSSKNLNLNEQIEIEQEINFIKLMNYKLLNENNRNLVSNFNDNFEKLLKTKKPKVAWFVSNCQSGNNRLEYAKELSKYIQVDIYGKCGNYSCSKWNETNCLNFINENYKFYLSFENSNCRQYITEKLFKNALGYNNLNHIMLPIVMGPPRIDYEHQLPPRSFIHVDDFDSPKELANYLSIIENNDELYYGYFQWKLVGEFIDTKFMCRVCAMLNAHLVDSRNKNGYITTKSVNNIKEWWLNDNSLETCEYFN